MGSTSLTLLKARQISGDYLASIVTIAQDSAEFSHWLASGDFGTFNWILRQECRQSMPFV